MRGMSAGWHRVVAQFVGANPCKVLAFARGDSAFPLPADVKRHQQVKVS